MSQKSVVMTAAWLEIVTGAVFLTVLDVACQMLFAAKPEGLGIILAQVGGLALLALGVACLPSGSCHGAVLGLSVWNVGIALLLAWVGVATNFRGVLLWPVIALHAVLAIALLRQILTSKGFLPDSSRAA